MATDKRLEETLESVGVSLRKLKYEVVVRSGAKLAGNRRVHSATNTLIEQVLRKGDLGHCVHVTGSARALTDPAHQSVCTAIVGEGNDPFVVLYNVPKERRSSPNGVVAWNMMEWGRKSLKTWRDKMQAIDLVGYGSVDLRAYDAIHDIQYSVFGHKFVQLQGLHKEAAASKPVWLLQSEKLNQALSEQALTAITKSDDIDESWFREFSLNLHGLTSRYILRRIRDKPGLDRDGLLSDIFLQDAVEDPSQVLEALGVMDFVRMAKSGSLEMTADGLDFTNAL